MVFRTAIGTKLAPKIYLYKVIANPGFAGVLNYL